MKLSKMELLHLSPIYLLIRFTEIYVSAQKDKPRMRKISSKENSGNPSSKRAVNDLYNQGLCYLI